MKQIMIGGYLATVPDGYIKAESKFTKEETVIFYALPHGPKKELARDIVLGKRIEFYALFLAGKVDIPSPPSKPRTFRQKLAGFLIGKKW